MDGEGEEGEAADFFSTQIRDRLSKLTFPCRMCNVITGSIGDLNRHRQVCHKNGREYVSGYEPRVEVMNIGGYEYSTYIGQIGWYSCTYCDQYHYMPQADIEVHLKMAHARTLEDVWRQKRRNKEERRKKTLLCKTCWQWLTEDTIRAHLQSKYHAKREEYSKELDIGCSSCRLTITKICGVKTRSNYYIPGTGCDICCQEPDVLYGKKMQGNFDILHAYSNGTCVKCTNSVKRHFASKIHGLVEYTENKFKDWESNIIINTLSAKSARK